MPPANASVSSIWRSDAPGSTSSPSDKIDPLAKSALTFLRCMAGGSHDVRHHILATHRMRRARCSRGSRIRRSEYSEMTLRFVREAGFQHCRIRLLSNAPNHEIPERPGAYVLMSADERFRYPMGCSRVFYIGQSDNLNQRLGTHWAAVSRRLEHPERIFRPRYEYAAAFGVKYCYVGIDRIAAEDLEVKLFVAFAKRYRGYPVANGSIPREVREQFIG